MFMHLGRKLILAATLTAKHFSHSTSNNDNPDSVTGGDPEPTSPDVILIILTILSLA
jgi:hypothetical protein